VVIGGLTIHVFESPSFVNLVMSIIEVAAMLS
jgi:hypothetical protein